MQVYLNYIEGKWVEGHSPSGVVEGHSPSGVVAGSLHSFEANRNPACPKQVLGQATKSSAEDIKRAVGAASCVQRAWVKIPRPKRGEYLAKCAAYLEKNIEILATLLTEEEGKNLNESRGECLKAIRVLEFMASESRRPVGEMLPSEMPGTMIYTTRMPLGVVGIITPWNFPVCIPAWKIAPALLEGNAVVFKPASLTPATARFLVKAFEETGLPPGVLNLVYGSGSTVGNALIADSRVRAISFTGSNEIGAQVHALAAKRFCRTQLEMGGKNPVVVLEDADLDCAADAVVMGAFGSTGQRCTATSRVILVPQIREVFVQKLLERVRKIKVGNGLKDPTAMGPVVDENQYKAVLSAIQKAKKDGAKILCGGEPLADEQGGYFISPTVFDGVNPASDLAQKEIFGPVLAILNAKDFEQALELANNVEYGLSASLFTQDISSIQRFNAEIECGIVHINSATVGGEAQAPFGGVKQTGLGGREMGKMGPEFFCEIKTVYVDYNTRTARTGVLDEARKRNLY